MVRSTNKSPPLNPKLASEKTIAVADSDVHEQKILAAEPLINEAVSRIHRVFEGGIPLEKVKAGESVFLYLQTAQKPDPAELKDVWWLSCRDSVEKATPEIEAELKAKK